MLIGYARVSTVDQNLALQRDAVARQSGWEDSDNQDENPGVAA